MIERRSAIAALLAQASHTHQETQPAVTLSERRPLTILQVSAFGSTQPEATAKLASVLNIDLPSPNQMTSNAIFSVRLLGPGIWQIIGDPYATIQAHALRSALSGVASVVDLSHARTAILVSGVAAQRTLNKFCSLDLALEHFAVGSATNTRFGHIGMTLARGSDELVFELLVFRGYAEHVLEALLEAGAEFGLRAEP
jgi:heterotetrameric sarcosine oxidase gamma subunit